MQMIGIERVISRTPEVIELLSSIPRVTTRIRRALGAGIDPAWFAEDVESLTHLYFVAGLVDMQQAEARRIDRLEARLESFDQKFETVRAAELNWQAIAATRDGIVFSNDTGETVTISRDFLTTIAKHHQLDASSAEDRGSDVVFLDGDQVLVQLPRTLWVVLPSVLDRCSWFPEQP